jgi:hypothetical protein
MSTLGFVAAEQEAARVDAARDAARLVAAGRGPHA